MRVITGIAKGKRLKAVPGDSTRPITDRTKEALFSILGNWILETRVLDLFGGTGAVGIEALSRGAEHAMFIDKSTEATRTIGENLRNTKLAKQAYVKRGDSLQFLKSPPLNVEPFDLIYIAPPQYKELWIEAIEIIDQSLDFWLKPDGVVIVQIHPREFKDLDLRDLFLYDERKYGSTLLCFYDRNEADEVTNDVEGEGYG